MKLSKLRAAHANRRLVGQDMPRQNTTSFGMRNALKRAGSTGYAGDSDGEAARPRLDRPGRKCGGRVKRESGGWVGEGDSGKKLRDEAKEVRDEPNFGKALVGSNVGNLAGAAALARKKGPGVLGFAAPAAGMAYGAKKFYDSLTEESRAKALEDKADKAEGRKRGGPAKQKGR